MAIDVGISASSNSTSGGPFSGGNSIFNFGSIGSLDAAENGFADTPTSTATASATGQGSNGGAYAGGGGGGGGGSSSIFLLAALGVVVFLLFRHKL